MGNKWTEEEIQILKDNYMTMTHKEMEKLLPGRTKYGLQLKLSELGLNKNFNLTRDFPRLAEIWNGIIKRCYNENSCSYHSYGGRGIKVCDEWMGSSRKFILWAIDNGYQEGLTIDRINVNGDYCPENCRWVDMETQCNNKRCCIYIAAFGETKTVSQWARDERCKINKEVLFRRIKNNFDTMSTEEMITKPARKIRKRNASERNRQ